MFQRCLLEISAKSSERSEQSAIRRSHFWFTEESSCLSLSIWREKIEVEAPLRWIVSFSVCHEYLVNLRVISRRDGTLEEQRLKRYSNDTNEVNFAV